MANHPRFGMIHAPKSRADKMKHQSVLNTIPIELVPAVDEWKTTRTGRLSKFTDPISSIVLRYETTPEMELIQSVCKACAVSEYDDGIWGVFASRATELLPSLNAFDCAMLLKCLILFETTSKSKVDKPLILSLFHGLMKTEPGSSHPGHHAILYGFQALNHFGSHFDSRTNAKYFNHLLRNIRLSLTSFPVLLGCLQAVSVRNPIPNAVLLGPLLTEIGDRIETKKVEFDTDTLFGIISSVARIQTTCESQRILTLLKEKLLDSEEPYVYNMSLEQLVGVAHSYSRMGPAVNAKTIDIFTLVGNELCKCSSWTPRTIAVSMNAYGAACVAHSDLVEAWKQIPEKIVNQMDSRQISMSVYGLSKLGVLDQFTSFMKRADQIVGLLDLHSTSKLIAAVEPTGHGITAYLDHFMQVVKHGQASGKIKAEDIESISLVLDSIKAMGDEKFKDTVDCLFSIIANEIAVARISNVSLLVSRYSSYRSESFTRLNEACLNRILDSEDACNLSLTEIVRFMHVFGLVLKLTPDQSEGLRKCIISRHSDLSKLGYRTLTRLAAAMIRCGVYDEDITSSIDENLRKFKLDNRKVS